MDDAEWGYVECLANRIEKLEVEMKALIELYRGGEIVRHRQGEDDG